MPHDCSDKEYGKQNKKNSQKMACHFLTFLLCIIYSAPYSFAETDIDGKTAKSAATDFESSSGETQEIQEADSEEITDSRDSLNPAEEDESSGSETESASGNVSFDSTVTVDGVKINVTADEGVFPDGSELSARKVSSSEKTKTEDTINKTYEQENVAAGYTFDITITDADGNEIEPENDAGKVSVSFETDEVASANLKTNIYHIKETASSGIKAEKLDTEITGTKIAAAETDGFSYYTLEFTYGDLQYVMDGDSSVLLSGILEKVGLTGTVTAASSSDEKLFTVEQQQADWLVTAKKAFSSNESLLVTIDGIEYEIAVTDDSGVTVTIQGYKDGDTSGLRLSELLYANVTGYTGNIENLTFKWTNNVIDSASNSPKLQIFDTSDMTDSSNNDSNSLIDYGSSKSGAGYMYAALTDTTGTKGGSATTITTPTAGTGVTVTVYDGNTELCTATYGSFAASSLTKDMANLALALFIGDSKEIKTLLAASSILHVNCQQITTKIEEVTTNNVISYTTSGSTYTITGVNPGAADVKLTMNKSGCRYHYEQSVAVNMPIRVFKKPTVTTTSTTLTLNNIEEGVSYTVDGVTKVATAYDVENGLTFSGLTKGTKYEVMITATITSEGGATSTAYAYTSGTTIEGNTYNITVNVTKGTAKNAGTGYTLSSGSSVEVDDGGSLILSFAADKGYELYTVTVNGGTAALTGGTYTFSNVAANSTIAVVYKTAKYTVNLVGNGGSGTALTEYTYGTGATLPTNWMQNNLTFAGWYEDSDFSGSKVTAISETDTGDKKYYAKWTATVTFE